MSTMMPGSNSEGDASSSSGSSVMKVILVVLIVAVSILIPVIPVVILVVYCIRRRRLPFSSSLERDRHESLSAIDNALFRVGSAFSRSSTRMQKVRDPEEEGTTSNKRAPTLKESTSYQTEISILQEPTLEEQAYEEKKQREEAGSLRKGLSCEKINESVSKIDVKNDLTSPLSQDSAVVPDYHPYDTPGSTPYSIPSGTPAVLESSTVVDIIQDTSVYQIPSGLSVPQDSSVYQIPSGLSVAQDSSVYQIPSGVSYKEEGMTVTDGPTADNPDYIFMSTSPDDVLANENEYADPEEYKDRFQYSSVEYNTLLQQATVDIYGEEVPYRAPPSKEEEIYVFIAQQKIKIIPRQAVKTTETVGSGHFGTVSKGVWRSTKKNTTLDVALKTVSEKDKKSKLKLLQEAVVMGQFSHPNILQLYGIVSQGEPLVLVMEYMAKRDLKKHLMTLRPQQGEVVDTDMPGLLLSFSEQIALGMHYLASKKLVHRDLAARNILVSQDDTCKIGDFGMSRNMNESGFYVGGDGKVPLKWTAPEAISLKKYSTASDVWSYGCVLYEIWSLGHKPFKGFKNDEAVVKITTGYRLPPPPGCPQAIYSLMIRCWHPVSSARPKYQNILTSLLEDPKKVLHIPQEDAASHACACQLGGSVAAGTEMYPDLQNTYAIDEFNQHNPDYEYMNSQDTDSDTH